LAGWALCHGLASLHADGILADTLRVDLHRSAKALVRMLVMGVAAPGVARAPTRKTLK